MSTNNILSSAVVKCVGLLVFICWNLNPSVIVLGGGLLGDDEGMKAELS